MIDEENKGSVIRIQINNNMEMRKGGLKELRRMNITSATLFPGLEGFSESLHLIALFPEIWPYVG
jgi:hypothetical protein